MQFYNTKVRLRGNINNEVIRTHVSAPEFLVLQTIHGEDALVDTSVSAYDETVDHTALRETLRSIYEPALLKMRPAHTIDSLFGKYAKLPEKADGAPAPLQTEEDSGPKRKPGRPRKDEAPADMMA